MPEDFSFLADPTAFEDVLPKFKKDSTEARAARAQALGYTVQGDIASKGINGILNTFPLSANRFAPEPGEQASFLNQLGALLGYEAPRLQEAANRQYIRGAEAIGDFTTALGEETGRIEKATAEQAAPVEQFAGRAEGLGDEAVGRARSFGQSLLERTDEDVARVNADIDKQGGYLDKALEYAAESVGSAKTAVSGFDAGYNEAIRASVAGLNRRADNTLAQIQAGRSADGTPLSDADKWQMRRELLFDTGQQVAQTNAQMRDRMQTTLASLRMGLSEAEARAGQIALGAAGEARAGAQTRLGAAGLRAEVGAQVADIEARAEQTRLSYNQLAGQAREFVASLKNAGLLQAVMAKIEGLQTRYQMIQGNPESIVSIFSALTALGQFATAPGASKVPGIGFGAIG